MQTSSTVSAPEKSSVSGIGHSSYTTLVQLTISRSSYLNTVHSSSSLQKSYQLTTSTTHLGLLSSQTEARPQSSETNTRISYSSKYTLLSSVTKTKFASSSEYTPLSLGTTHSSGPSSTSFQRTATSITQHSTSPPNPKSILPSPPLFLLQPSQASPLQMPRPYHHAINCQLQCRPSYQFQSTTLRQMARPV